MDEDKEEITAITSFSFFSNINRSFNWLLIFHICLCRWAVVFLGGSGGGGGFRLSVCLRESLDGGRKRESGEVGRACCLLSFFCFFLLVFFGGVFNDKSWL